MASSCHVDYLRGLWTAYEMSYGGNTVIYKMAFNLSWPPLYHALCFPNGSNGSFFFFPSLPIDFHINPIKFKGNPSIYYFFIFGSCSFNYYFLFYLR